MAKQDRKQRLRSLQQTAQLQTGGLPGISSYQPKAATQGKSNEAQMANALAQLAPSLTEFLGTKFQSDKKAGIAKGRQKFFQDTASQRQQRQFDIFAGKLDEDEFFVEGYQRSWLRNLGRSYGLGLTSMLDKIPKNLSDEEFFKSIEEYDQEFRKTNGLNLYEDDFINEEFLPQQENFKNVIQQAWSAQRRQLLAEQADAAFQLELFNDIENANTFLTGNPDEVGSHDLADALEQIPDIIERLNERGIKIDNELDLSTLFSKITQTSEDLAFQYDLYEFDSKGKFKNVREGILAALAQTKKGTQENKDHQTLIDKGTVQALVSLKSNIQRKVDEYGKRTGDFNQANKLAAQQISRLAIENNDVNYLKLIDFIEVNGSSWGNTGDAKAIKATAENQIKDNIYDAQTKQYALNKKRREELVRLSKGNISKVVRGTKRLPSGALDLDDDQRLFITQTIQLLEDEGAWEEANKLKLYTNNYTTFDEEIAQEDLRNSVATGSINFADIRIDGSLAGMEETEIDKLEKQLQDKQYRDKIFKKGSEASLALNNAFKVITKKPVGTNQSLEEWYASFSSDDPKNLERLQNALKFRQQLTDYAIQRRDEILKENTNISQAQLDFQLSRDVANKAVDTNFIKPFLPAQEEVDDKQLSAIETHPSILKLDVPGLNPLKTFDDKFPYVDSEQYIEDRNTIYAAIIQGGFKWDMIKGEESSNSMVQMMVKLLNADGMGLDGTNYSNYRGKPKEAFKFLAKLLDAHFEIPENKRLRD